MSLLDAILLEPHRDPKDVWIALRSDGNKGSGTQNDPYHGGVQHLPEVSISNLTQDTDPTVAVAVTSQAHGLINGDLARIEGVTGAEAEFYNGQFVVHDVDVPNNSFKYTMKGDPEGNGSGSSRTSSKVVLLFDKLMESLATSTYVELVPKVTVFGEGLDPGMDGVRYWL